jgi:hypothetical protein
MCLDFSIHYYDIDTGDEEVELHLKSVNHKQMMPYGYIMYYQKMKTNIVRFISLFFALGQLQFLE